MIINPHKVIKCIYNILYFSYKITLIILMIHLPLYSQNKSYFFTNEQSDAILDKLNNKNKINKKRNKKKIIEYKLSGICYLSIYNWVVWINGQSYNKIGQYSQFSIDEVTPDSVTITTLDCKTIHLTVKCDNTCVISKTEENSNYKDNNINGKDNNINNVNYNDVIKNSTTNKTINDINNMDANNIIQNNNIDNSANTTNNVITNSTNNNTTQNNNIDSNSDKKNTNNNNNTKNIN